jgi:hypothetical protein
VVELAAWLPVEELFVPPAVLAEVPGEPDEAPPPEVDLRTMGLAGVPEEQAAPTIPMASARPAMANLRLARVADRI